MKNLPGYLNKLKRRTSRWDELQEVEGEAEAELAASNLLHKKMDLTPNNFELETETLEDAFLKVHPDREGTSPPKTHLTDFQRQLDDITHEMKLRSKQIRSRESSAPKKRVRTSSAKKKKQTTKRKVVKKSAEKEPVVNHEKELSGLGKRISNLKKEIKSRVASIEAKKMKLSNYREKSPATRPPRETKKIAKRAQTSVVEARFASKTKDGRAKRALLSKTLTKEQTLKKMKKKVAITRDPPSYH